VSKEITVRLTVDWTFDEKEWESEKVHIASIKADPKIILGEDILDSLHILNEMAYPKIKNIQVLN
jgi:hypothetical protein